MIRRTLAAAVLSALAVPPVMAEGPSLTAAISLDIPPYVIDDASTGLQVDIVRRALEGYTITFEQMPYSKIDAALRQGPADMAVSVQYQRDGTFYSNDYIGFANAAITKKSAGIEIEKVADLKGHPIFAWQGAFDELGGVFEGMYAPGALEQQSYREFPNQENQVRTFWEQPAAVAVIDKAIFKYFTQQLGHSMDEVVVHPIFPPVTDFKVAFKDEAVRDQFNEGLAKLCQSGEYAGMLDTYGVVLKESPCDDPS